MDSVGPAPVALDEARVFRWILIASATVAVVVFLCAILVAVELPFGEWDAMSFGSWAREIANHWPHFEFIDAGASDLHRPLFYFFEGTAWATFGVHQALGRLLALAFGVVLAAALAYTAGTSAPRRYAPGAAAVVLAFLVATVPYERYLVSGLSDIPVAAMVALTAASLLAARARPRLLPFVGVAAGLAMLTKPTALASLLGLMAAVVVGPRAGVRRRFRAAAAVAAGTLVALAYDWFEARRLHMGIRSFLTSGSGGYYSSLAAHSRRDILLDQSWLGSDLRLLLIFGLLYGIARLATRHRVAVAVALPAAFLWSVAGPHIAGGASGIVPGSGGSLQSFVVLVLAASLLCAFASPTEAIPARLELARLLIWLTPPLGVWIVYAAYDVRLLSAAWPPLLLLLCDAVLPAFAGAAAIDLIGLTVPATAALVLAALGIVQLNGFGGTGWHRFDTDFGVSSAMRKLAVGGDFNAELAALQAELPTTRSIITADARLHFYYPTRVHLEPPQSCTQLQPVGTTLVLLESPAESTLYGNKASEAYWQDCSHPRVTLVAERPGAFAVFTTRGAAPGVSSCGANPTPGLAVEFGRFRAPEQAQVLLTRAKAVGFVEARVEQVGCSTYRVVETGIPSRLIGRSILAEAKSAHLRAQLVTSPAR